MVKCIAYSVLDISIISQTTSELVYNINVARMSVKAVTKQSITKNDEIMEEK